MISILFVVGVIESKGKVKKSDGELKGKEGLGKGSEVIRKNKPTKVIEQLSF